MSRRRTLRQMDVAEEWRSRAWPVRVVGILLALQSIAFIALSIRLLLQQDWQPLLDLVHPTPSALSLPHLQALSVSVLLLPAGATALVAALAILFLRPFGWLLAMIVQGLTLGGCLDLYFILGPPEIYPVMLYSILLVLYLNSYDVRLVLQQEDAADGTGPYGSSV